MTDGASGSSPVTSGDCAVARGGRVFQNHCLFSTAYVW
ncbi:hypothetical protein THTE_0147 [Thermogutta terrifontis]|uniref:Uncharacterized protein n=1 Tax=Thermogutta terrifontis TaxID=1331910 RepID=A0A286R9W8_9BACT|nr:hypothetical protein THTE_0147 [Thermogutta terrifontis]